MLCKHYENSWRNQQHHTGCSPVVFCYLIPTLPVKTQNTWRLKTSSLRTHRNTSLLKSKVIIFKSILFYSSLFTAADCHCQCGKCRPLSSHASWKVRGAWLCVFYVFRLLWRESDMCKVVLCMHVHNAHGYVLRLFMGSYIATTQPSAV